VRATTTAELQALLAQGEKLTVVDVRSEELFKAGHIPNAINIPHRVVARKNLPPLGRVVVCDRGLGEGNAAHAVELLNEKPGIQAEVLEGGYAAWETNLGGTTVPPGFQPERLNYITYQNLADINTEDVVLVDLRKPAEPSTGRYTRQGVSVETAPLSALDEKFPGKVVVNSPFDISAVSSRTGGTGNLQRMSSESEKVPVMVLIDNGDGEAEKTARVLRANGIRQVVILAGGERIIERDGSAGMKRMGMAAQTVEADDE
jgi:rhodanese-related sulfurtransferase